MRGPLALAALFVCLAAPARSAQPEWITFATGQVPFPDDFSLEALALTDARRVELEAADAPYTDLLWWFEIDLTQEGLVTERIVQARHYLSDRHTEWGGELEFLVNPSFENAIIHSAHTIAGDGSRLPVSPDSVQQLDYVQPRVFSDLQRVIVPVPGLAAGATTVLAYELSFRSAEWPLPWSTLFSLKGVSPVERFVVSVVWAEGDEPPAWRTNDASLECEEQPQRRLHCEKREESALQIDPDAGALRDVLPELVLERSGTWSSLSERVGSLVRERLRQEIPPGVVEPLLAGTRTPEEKWEALYRFVAKEVRYLGLEHRIASIVPNPPLQTLERRYGDCKDKVTLLIALAKAAGLDAHPVLVATGRRDVSRLLLPAASYFDHMIACRRDEGGEQHCADATVVAASASESLLPVAGNAVLDLEPTTTRPRALPLPAFAWDIEVDGVTELHCDGGVESVRTRRLTGMAAQAYRAGLASLTPAARRRALAEEFQQAAGGAPGPVTVENLDDASRPLVITASFAIPGSGRLVDRSSFREGSLWLRFHGLSLRSENRAHPFRNPGLRVRSRQRYDLCDETRARFGGAVLEMEAPFGTLRRDYAVDGDGVTVTSELRVPGGDVPATDIPRFNRFLESALDQTDVWFGLEPRR